MNEPELGQWVRRARQGDLAAYGRLVELTQTELLRQVQGITRDRELARDVVQEAYLRAFARLKTLLDLERFEAWLGRLARNLAKNQLRARRTSFVSWGEGMEPVSSAQERGLGERTQALERALLILSTDERRLCERYYHGRWTTARLAEEEGLSESTVRKRLERLRRRLRREMLMTLSPDEVIEPAPDLPYRIVELLAKPVLTDIPENPVGAVWQYLRRSLPDYEVTEVQEVLAWDEIVGLFGKDRAEPRDGRSPFGYTQHHLDDGRVLRSDTSVPLLLHAAGHPGPQRRIACGKVYRQEVVDHSHLEAFHQGEVLWVGEDADQWALARWLSHTAHDLLGSASLRFEEVSYPLMCQAAWELSIRVEDDWRELAAWGVYHDDLAQKLGGCAAVGAGLGLDRLACLVYGIDDIRKVESATI